MSRGFLLKPLCLIVILALFGIAHASPPPPAPFLTGQQLLLTPYFLAIEDQNGTLTPNDLLFHPDSLQPLNELKPVSPTSYYWLKTELSAGAVPDPSQVLSFNNLTYVDIYLYHDDSLITHRQAGAFRRRSDIDEFDGRLYSILPLVPGQKYTLLLRVHHTKHYQPVFDFSMQNKRDYFHKVRNKESIDAALQGAVALFFVYTLLSWVVSKYKLYLWLMLFIAGVGLYVISSAGYFIEWFFPDDPPTGWLFNVHFLDIGLFGLYLLLRDFWKMKTNHPFFYRWIRWVPTLLAVSSLTYFIIDYTTGNYRLTNDIHLWENPLMLTIVVSAIYTCWNHLNHPQRYLGYGILLITLAGLCLAISSLFFHERSLAIAPLIGDFTILGVFLLFSTGLKEEMRQHEVDKQAALEKLNQLQQHQNVILEKKVDERTQELNISNKRLLKQKHLLAERNSRIETLINELNHRVKNNLQLLYSLLSLQLPLVKDGFSRDILKGNIGKIRAMMLVNQKLFNFEKGRNIGLCEFVGELASHLQKIHDAKESTRILQNIPTGIQLSDKHTLSFGLILSELFTNTFKHAFRDHPSPCICVEAVSLNDHTLQFVYSDNGNTLTDLETGDRYSMGIPLIKDLTRQMNGQMSISKDRGLSYSFIIPV